MTTEAKIEALLFIKSEPVKLNELSKVLDIDKEKVISSVESLKKQLQGRGIDVLINDEDISLVTAKDAKEIIEKVQKEELSKELSKNALETLAVIIYTQNPTKSQIDHIRGVNSQFILRNLMIRGLIKKQQNKRDPIYQPTSELLRFMGVTSPSDLPNKDNITKQMEEILEERIEEDK